MKFNDAYGELTQAGWVVIIVILFMFSCSMITIYATCDKEQQLIEFCQNKIFVDDKDKIDCFSKFFFKKD